MCVEKMRERLHGLGWTTGERRRDDGVWIARASIDGGSIVSINKDRQRAWAAVIAEAIKVTDIRNSNESVERESS